MASKTHYTQAATLNSLLRNTAYTPLATIYVALFTSSPGESGSLSSEITGNAYVRQAITFGAPANQSNGALCTQTGNITFPVDATGNWGTITYVGLMDAPTSGNMLYYQPLTTPQTVNVGNQFVILAGNITVLEE